MPMKGPHRVLLNAAEQLQLSFAIKQRSPYPLPLTAMHHAPYLNRKPPTGPEPR